MDGLLRTKIDRSVLTEIRAFFEAINQRNLYVKGHVDSYEAPDPALDPEVEYFSPQITLDDRMIYNMRHVVTVPGISDYNRFGNVIISHFYGAPGIHQSLTGIADPDKAHVDFQELAREQRTGKPGDYTLHLRDTLKRSLMTGAKIWSRTQLQVSLQSASNKFVSRTFGEEHKTPLAMAEWMAGWINSGFTDRLLSATTLKKAYESFCTMEGIGPYYGYHGAVDHSLDPKVPYTHDEAFCSPGPGCCMTLEKLFPGVSKREAPMGERVVWIRDNQDELFPNLCEQFHPDTWNITAHGTTVFSSPENRLRVYGLEVGLCQYSVYCRLRDNPKLISNRKVPVSKPSSIVSFFDQA